MINFKDKSYAKSLKFLAVAVAFLGIYSLGWAVGHEDLKIERGFIPRSTTKSEKKDNVDFSLFWRIWDEVEGKYDGKIDTKKMLYGAISGMVSATGDPYTYYMDPNEAGDFRQEIDGEISGIGAEIGIKNEQVTIIAPFLDTPAHNAGLRPGDIIVSINDETTAGMSLDTAVSKIRGKESTSVKLKIMRNQEQLDINITRQKIDIKSVSWKNIDNYGYLYIRKFNEDTAALTATALEDFKKRNVKAIIIDVRNNPGGYLDSAIKTTSQFIKDGDIVVEKKGDKILKKHKTSGLGKYVDKKIPVVVLINKGSASAAEIMAGAIKDHERGILIGENTFGKGSVQELSDFGDGSSLRVTVAHWFTPKGQSINERGVAPDKVVEFDEAKLTVDEDPILKKALEYLNSKV